MEAYFSRMHWPCRKVRPKNASWCTKQLRKFVLLSVIYCSIKLDSHNEKNLPSCVPWDNVMHDIYSQSMDQLYSHYPSLAKEYLPSKKSAHPLLLAVLHTPSYQGSSLLFHWLSELLVINTFVHIIIAVLWIWSIGSIPIRIIDNLWMRLHACMHGVFSNTYLC